MKTHNFDEAPFSKFFGNVYSQNGEDGVIEEILNRIGWSDLSLWAAEFGAWDGKYLSNCFNLVRNCGWFGLFIEANDKKFNNCF